MGGLVFVFTELRQPPPGLPPPIATIIRTQVPLLSNNFDGSNVLVAASFTNFGGVDTLGIDTALNYYVTDAWTFSFGYSWFDFRIKDELPGFDSLLLPNSPSHKSVWADLPAPSLRRSIQFPLVDGFRWGVGPFQGDVKNYTTVDVVANVSIDEPLLPAPDMR